MLLSIVVNYFNPKAYSRVQAITVLCLEALKDCTHSPLEVILSDGSGVECGTMRGNCERLGFRYSLSPTPKNFGAIYNHGLMQARGDLVGIMENDVFVVHDWDRLMLAEMHRTGAGMAVPYISSCDNHIQEHGFVVKHCTFEPTCISHNVMVFDRRTFNVIVPFDTRFHATFNDNDIYLKMKAAGVRMIACFAGRIVHFRGSSAAYNPWNPMEHDIQIFREKYPNLKWRPMGMCPYSVADPLFCRSRVYMNLLRMVNMIPRRWSAYLIKHLGRLEPLFHRC